MKRAGTVVALALLFACGGPEGTAPQAPSAASTPRSQSPLPTADEARSLIAASAEFGDFQFTSASWSTPMKRSAMNEPTQANAKELVAAGWLRFNGDDLLLGTKASGDKRFLVRPNGFLDIVPLAKKELGQVSQPVRDADGTARAEFCFRWIANNVGESFRTGLVAERVAATHCGTATLQQRAGGGWEVLLLTAAPTTNNPPA